MNPKTVKPTRNPRCEATQAASRSSVVKPCGVLAWALGFAATIHKPFFAGSCPVFGSELEWG